MPKKIKVKKRMAGKKNVPRNRKKEPAIRRPKPQKVIININKLLSLEEAIKYVVDLSGEKENRIFFLNEKKKKLSEIFKIK